MSLQLQPDQLLIAIQRLGHIRALEFEHRLFDLCNEMAAAIVAEDENLTLGGLRTNLQYEMVCTPITPIDRTQPIPEHLQGLDDGGWE